MKKAVAFIHILILIITALCFMQIAYAHDGNGSTAGNPLHDHILLDTHAPTGTVSFDKGYRSFTKGTTTNVTVRANNLTDNKVSGVTGSGIDHIDWTFRKKNDSTGAWAAQPSLTKRTPASGSYSTAVTSESVTVPLDRAIYDCTITIYDRAGNSSTAYRDNVYDCEATTADTEYVYYPGTNRSISMTVNYPPSNYGYTVKYGTSNGSYPYDTLSYGGTNGVTGLNQGGVGTYTIYWQVSAEYYNTIRGSNIVRITSRDISEATVAFNYSKVYDGNTYTPKPTITYGGYTLQEGKDYKLTYPADVKNVGTKTLKIEGINNFKGTITKTYTITTREITVTADNKTMQYSDPEPPLTVTMTNYIEVPALSKDPSNGGLTRTHDTNTPEKVGTYKISNNGMTFVNAGGFLAANYTMKFVEGTFTIVTKPIPTETKLEISPTSFVYNGGENKPSITTFVINGRSLTTADYDVSYSNNVNVGTGTVTVTGKGNYSGTLAQQLFKITPRPLTITADNKTRQYRQNNPTFTVSYNTGTDVGLVTGETPGYNGNITTLATYTTDVGTYPISLDNYVPKDNGKFKILNYSITKVNGTLTITPCDLSTRGTLTLGSYDNVYNEKEKKPAPTVKLDDGYTVEPNTGYTTAYTNNINDGTATCTITGKGNYKNSLSKTFTIIKANIILAANVQGNSKVGTVLTTMVDVSPNDANLTYQWYRTGENATSFNGTAISGATAKTYTVTNDDLYCRLYVTVGAKKEHYNDNSVTVWAPSPIVEDTQPDKPTIEAKLDNSSGATYNSQWTNHNVWIRIKSMDASGIKEYQYSTVNATSGFNKMTDATSDRSRNRVETYAQMTVTTNQNEVMYYFRAMDQFGNYSDVSSILLRIDKDAPIVTEISKTPTAYTNGNVSVRAKATDTLSKISGFYFGTNATSTSYTTVSPADNPVIREKTYEANATGQYYVVKDQAGNVGYGVFEVTNIDKVPPVITPTLKTYTENRMTYDVKVTDNLSGPKELFANTIKLTDFADIGGGAKQSTYNITKTGTYTFEATDNALNTGTTSFEIFGINYNGNGVDGTMAPQLKEQGSRQLTVKQNQFVSSEYEFVNWNTKPDGTGTTYTPGQIYSANATITLYAQWKLPDVNLKTLILEKYEYDYTGKAITPQEKVYNNNDLLLTKDLEYEVVYQNNIDVGTGKVVIHGLGRYLGQSLEAEFKIVGTPVLAINAELEKDIYVYDSTQKKPRAIVTYGSETLVDGKDYIMTYRDNIEVGTAYAVITGIGPYYSVIEKPFSIIRADRNLHLYDVGMKVGEVIELDYTYDGEQTGTTITVDNPSVVTATKNSNGVTTLTGNQVGTSTVTYSVGQSRNYNAATETRQVVVFDESFPVYGSVVINNDDEYTNYNRMVLYIRAFCAEYMYVSTENVKPAVDDPGWNDYSTRLPYIFSNDEGEKVIYVWFKDVNGNMSEAASDTIILTHEFDYPAHDSIVLDQTNPNTTAPTIDFAQHNTNPAKGLDVFVNFKQQDQMVNGVRSGIDKATIEYGVKKTLSSGGYTWQSNNRFNLLEYGTDYTFVTRVKDRAGNGPQISDIYTFLLPVRYEMPLILTDTMVQTDGKIHEIDPVQYQLVEGHDLTKEIIYTYYTDRECQHLTQPDQHGCKVAGGPPSASGTYYVIARLRDDPEYHDVDSNVGKLHIGWYIGDEAKNIFSYVEENATGTNEYTLNVIGEGNMLDLDNIVAKDTTVENTYWIEYKDRITVLNIGQNTSDRISTIGADVFSGLTEISQIRIPDTVEKIGSYAFKGDYKVTNDIIIPASTKQIGTNPFADVSTTKFEVKYGNSYYDTIDGVLVTINQEELIAYPAGRTNKEYEVPEVIKHINESAFYGNDYIEHIVIPNGVETIGGRAFYDCSKLYVIEILDLQENSDTTRNLQSIGNEAFFNIKEGSSIFTYSKEVADLIQRDVTYQPSRTTVYYPPTITLHPIDMYGAVSRKVTFIVEAEPGYTDDLNYEWHVIRNGVDSIANGTTVSSGKVTRFTTAELGDSNDGEEYYCVVYNTVPPAYNSTDSYYHSKGYARSNTGTLTMLENANYEVYRSSNDNYYFFTRMQEAFDFAESNDRITVLKDVTEEPNAVLYGDKKITFTGDGHTVSMTGMIEIKSGCDITFFGTGTVTKTPDTYNQFIIYNAGNITMNDGMTISYPSGSGIDLANRSELTINGGTVSAKTDAIKNTNGQIYLNGENAKVITNSDNSSTHAISMYENARIEINHGSIEAKNQVNGYEVVGLYVEGSVNGRIVINSGTIRATGASTSSGSALVNAGSADFFIEGGTFIGTKAGIETNASDRFGDIFLRAGTVEGGKYGILNNAYNSRVVLGVADRNVTDSTPVVKGETVAIYNAKTLDTLEFYDGTLLSRGTNIIYEMVSDVTYEVSPEHPEKVYTEAGRQPIITEIGYSIFIDTEGSYNRGTLKMSKVPELTDVPDQEVDEGEKGTFYFDIKVPGHPEVYTFEWEVSTDGGRTWSSVTAGTGMNTMSYTTPPVTPLMDGNLYRCKVTNAAGSTYTNAATLRLKADLSFKDMRPVIRIVYTDGKEVKYDSNNVKSVDMQIIIKSFARIDSIKYSYASTRDFELLQAGGIPVAGNTKAVENEYEIRNDGIISVDRGNDIIEYTQTFSLKALKNGLINIVAKDSNARESTETQTIDVFSDIVVSYTKSELSNINPDMTITFVANKPVKPKGSTVNGSANIEYSKLVSSDGNLYSYKYIYNPTEAIPDTVFSFEDEYGNVGTCAVTKEIRVQYREIKFNNNSSVTDIDDMTVKNAYVVGDKLEQNVETNANLDIQSRFGVNKVQVDMFMGRARDVGAADILSEANRARSYDGVYANEIVASNESDSAYSYVDESKNTYMATTLETEAAISNDKNVDKISRSKLDSSGTDAYKGQNISGFVADTELPYMYKDASGAAVNINGETAYDATFRAVIVGN